jgi:peptidoglycan/LPS O-acetylase OafA/YrhL
MIGLALSLAIAYLFYRLVEKPAQQWSSRIKYRREKTTEEHPVLQNEAPLENG